LSRGGLEEIQRARMISALAEVTAESGVAKATVARIVARSGASRRTFYEQFEDREECLLAAFDEAVRRVAARVAPAYERPGRWRERIRAALSELLCFLEDDPSMARLLVVEVLGAGPRALTRRAQALERASAAVDEGRGEAGSPPPPLAAEGVVGGVFALIHARMLAPERTPPIELLNPLVAMVVLPYLGPSASRRELERVVPKRRDAADRVAGNPLRGLEMRLTYRTVRVLLVVGELGERESPGGHGSCPSNREIADAAGIRDQGQVSKLLARLEQLGLVANTTHPNVRGRCNAWVLTERGEEVRSALSAR
jgi:AcrR family transcriptional regulator